MIEAKKLKDKRRQSFDIDGCHSSVFGDFILAHFYDTGIVSINGCHVHFWIPESHGDKDLERLVAKARSLWDVVNFSWDYYPGGDRKICGIKVPEAEVEDVIKMFSSLKYLETNLTKVANGSIDGLKKAYVEFGLK